MGISWKKSPSSPSSIKNMGVAFGSEAHFVFALGLLLSLNSGYINGLCLGGLLVEGGSEKQGVSAFTGTYTKSGLSLANGEVKSFSFEVTLILSFIAGAMLAGFLNPNATPHKVVPSYGPTFLLGSACMIAASVAAAFRPEDGSLYYFAAMANGVQNGMTSTYSANLIRTTHLTGTSTDIGLILGQMLRGNWKNYWKFKVLIGLASFFWLGGFLSFYSATAFLSKSLWFSAGLFLTIGLIHITFVVSTHHVSVVQACVGNWEWDRVIRKMASSMNLADLPPEEQVDRVFDQIVATSFDDNDKNNGSPSSSSPDGVIQADKLKEALERMGIKRTRKNIMAMINVADDNSDGFVDRAEFHALVNMASLRSKRSSKGEKYVAPEEVEENASSASSISGHLA